MFPALLTVAVAVALASPTVYSTDPGGCMMPVEDTTDIFGNDQMLTPTLHSLLVKDIPECTAECCQTDRCNVVLHQDFNSTTNCFLYACHPTTTCSFEKKDGEHIFINRRDYEEPVDDNDKSTTTDNPTIISQEGDTKDPTSPKAPSAASNKTTPTTSTTITTTTVPAPPVATESPTSAATTTSTPKSTTGEAVSSTTTTLPPTTTTTTTAAAAAATEPQKSTTSKPTESPPKTAQAESQATPESTTLSITPTPDVDETSDNNATLTNSSNGTSNTTSSTTNVSPSTTTYSQISSPQNYTNFTTQPGGDLDSDGHANENETNQVTPTPSGIITTPAPKKSDAPTKPAGLTNSTTQPPLTTASSTTTTTTTTTPTTTTTTTTTPATAIATTAKITATAATSTTTAVTATVTTNDNNDDNNTTLFSTPFSDHRDDSGHNLPSNGTLDEQAQSEDMKETMDILLICAVAFGCIFVLAAVGILGKRVYDGYRKRHYSRLDYLINGMYN